MSTTPTRRAVLAAALLLALPSAAAADGKKVRIAMVGDSTMASYPNPPKDRPDLTGWGQVFGEFFTADVEVLNHAASFSKCRPDLILRRRAPIRGGTLQQFPGLRRILGD